MTYHGLLEYIRKAKDYGAPDDEISRRLRAAGWYQVDVQDALELYRKLSGEYGAFAPHEPLPPPPPPSMIERIVPRHYDPHLIAVAVLSFALGFLGYLWLSQ
jgi:hypothetical protein